MGNDIAYFAELKEKEQKELNPKTTHIVVTMYTYNNTWDLIERENEIKVDKYLAVVKDALDVAIYKISDADASLTSLVSNIVKQEMISIQLHGRYDFFNCGYMIKNGYIIPV